MAGVSILYFLCYFGVSLLKACQAPHVTEIIWEFLNSADTMTQDLTMRQDVPQE